MFSQRSAKNARSLNSSWGGNEKDREMIEEVEFPSEGAIIRGLLFLPDAPPEKLPLVIMAHGTSATVFMVADKYADAFRRSGFAVCPP